MPIVGPDLSFARMEGRRYVDRIAGSQRDIDRKAPDHCGCHSQKRVGHRNQTPSFVLDMSLEKREGFVTLGRGKCSFANVPPERACDFKKRP